MASMITTSDNPFDHFKDYDNWLSFDERNQYNCQELLARFANTSSDLSPADNDLLIDLACDEVLRTFPFGVLGVENVYYKKVQGTY